MQIIRVTKTNIVWEAVSVYRDEGSSEQALQNKISFK